MRPSHPAPSHLVHVSCWYIEKGDGESVDGAGNISRLRKYVEMLIELLEDNTEGVNNRGLTKTWIDDESSSGNS